MSSSRPPRFATWLLKKFGGSRDNDAMLGDLAERIRGGKSRAWYWKQVAISIAVSGRNGIHGHRLPGLLIGALVGGVSIADNIAKYDRHSSSAFPYFFELLIAPILIFSLARYWQRSGADSIAIRNAVRKVGSWAALVFGASHFVFTLWWFSIHPFSLLTLAGLRFPWPLSLVALLSGFIMFQLMRLSGFIATRLPKRGIRTASQ